MSPNDPSTLPDPTPVTPSLSPAASTVSWKDFFWTYCRIAALSFGGPAGQIAVMHRILVDEKKWVSEQRFLHALNYCMLLPGPEAQQLATYIGWLMYGIRGGLTAGLLFIAPGAMALLVLSIIYVNYQQVPLVAAIFFGLKPAVIAIVLEAVVRIGRRVLHTRTMAAISAFAFLAMAFFDAPFPVVILAAAGAGLVLSRRWPGEFVMRGGHGPGGADAESAPADRPVRSFWKHALLTSAVWLPLWVLPTCVLLAMLGPDSVFVHEGWFFSKMAVVTFGGAYSVLAYVAQQAVEHYGWLQPGEMLDGLGLAETTPGPLIMVVQFVGYLAAYRHPGPFSPSVAGLLGSLVTTWVTFVPSFYWIFLGAPYMERLRGRPRLNAAMGAITAAVVGVILNLWVWFVVHTVFSRVGEFTWGPIHVPWPEGSTLDVRAALLAIFALGLHFGWQRNLVSTLGITTLVGAIWTLL